MGKQWTHEMYVNRVYELVGDEYEVLSEYVKNNIKVLMLHKKCGNSFNMTTGDFKNGRRCPHCYGKFKKTTEQFKQEVYEVSKGEYKVLGKYINADTHI